MASGLKKLTLSPTKLDTFFKCQRKYFYQYVQSPFPAVEHSYFIVGNVAHKALEIFHRNHFQKVQWPLGLSSSFKEAVAAENAFEKCKQGKLTREDLFDVKEMLKNYLKFLRSGVAVNVFQLEKLAYVEISGVPVWLKADRVDRVHDGYTVIDYKTSKNPASKKEELESVQIPSYGWWLTKELNTNDVGLHGSYYYLRHIGSKKGIHTHVIDQAWMDDAADKYSATYKQLLNGCKYSKTTDSQNCRWCDYRLPCSTNYAFK